METIALPEARTSGPMITLARGAGWDAALRRAAFLVGICLVLSTQLLFDSVGLAERDPAELAAGWLEYFLEVLLTGATIFAAVAVADRVAPRESMARWAALFAAVAIGSIVAIAVLTAISYGDSALPPLSYLAGEVLRPMLLGGLVTFAYAMRRRSQLHARALQQIEIERASLERRMLEAELQVMQAQIEPHFLFNTLATVKRLYRTEPRGGERMLESLKHYLAAALPKFRDSSATLGREFELARAYLDVLQIRMGSRLVYTASLPAELVDVPFPSMMLLTLVENSIKHGLGAVAEGGRVELRAERTGDRLAVVVADTGAGFQGASGSGIGLANIRSRLRALHGEHASLSLESTPGEGVVATIQVPLP